MGTEMSFGAKLLLSMAGTRMPREAGREADPGEGRADGRAPSRPGIEEREAEEKPEEDEREAG